MEADAISKNGRNNPKSQMSRSCIFKFFAAIIAASIVFSGCDKDKDDDSGGNTASQIIAKVENASKYSDVIKVKLTAWDYTAGKDDVLVTVDFKNGGFTLDLPETLAAKYLASFEATFYRDEDEVNQLNISNKNAKMTLAEIEGFDADDESVTYFVYGKEDNNSSTVAYYIYSDSDVDISGTIKTTDDEYDWEDNENYSLNLKKGWNVIYLIEYDSTYKDGKEISNASITSSPVSGLKWYGNEDW